jgi:putative ABC transport system ATP-binding protein
MPTHPTAAHTTRGVQIRTHALSKRYHQGQTQITALAELDLHVPAGQKLAITGASGSGKSTLLHLVGAMDRPDSGTLHIGDQDITTLNRRQLATYRRGIGFVFQRFHLLPALTALDNIIAPVLPRRATFDRTARARELLHAVGLADRERSLPSQLSAGQQQRVAIARALIAQPALLLADEPTGNLDSTTGAEIINLLDRLATEHGFTMLVATHAHDLTQFCDRTIQLRDGAIIHDTRRGSPPSNLAASAPF